MKIDHYAKVRLKLLCFFFSSVQNLARVKHMKLLKIAPLEEGAFIIAALRQKHIVDFTYDFSFLFVLLYFHFKTGM